MINNKKEKTIKKKTAKIKRNRLWRSRILIEKNKFRIQISFRSKIIFKVKKMLKLIINN